MKFKKYGAELKSCILCCAALCILLLGLSISLSVWTGEYRCLLVIGLLPILFLSTSTYLFFVKMFREDKSNASDMIVINEEGISLECENDHNLLIPWNEVFKMEKKTYSGLYPLIYVTGVSGEVIWWYAPNKKAERYILELHPALAGLYTVY